MAIAYVGPGAGISLLGALWGLLLGIFMAIGVVLFWPIRAMIRKWRGRANTSDAAAEAGRRQQSACADLAVKAFGFSQALREKYVNADPVAKRHILEIICLTLPSIA